MIPKRRGDLSSDDDKLSLDLSSKGSRNDDSFGFTPRNSKRSSLNPKAGIAGLAGVGLGGGEKKVGGIGTSKLASGGRSEVEFDEPDQKFGHRLGFDLYSGQQGFYFSFYIFFIFSFPFSPFLFLLFFCSFFFLFNLFSSSNSNILRCVTFLRPPPPTRTLFSPKQNVQNETRRRSTSPSRP